GPSADPDLMRHVQAGATHARLRGATSAGAELFELALDRLPPDSTREYFWFQVDASEYHYSSGDIAGGAAILEEALRTNRYPEGRVWAMWNLARMLFGHDNRRSAALMDEALREGSFPPAGELGVHV